MVRLREMLATFQPWYDFGQREVFRLDMHCEDFADESLGKVWFAEIQWLGLHLAFEIGRTPWKISDAEIADYRISRLARKDG